VTSRSTFPVVIARSTQEAIVVNLPSLRLDEKRRTP